MWQLRLFVPHDCVARVFKAMEKAAGLEAGLVAAISGHSSRVGAAQDQVRYGVSSTGGFTSSSAWL